MTRAERMNTMICLKILIMIFIILLLSFTTMPRFLNGGFRNDKRRT